VREIRTLRSMSGDGKRGVCQSAATAPILDSTELIGDPTYADAILDRLVHNAHRINLTGHSLRRSRSIRAAKD